MEIVELQTAGLVATELRWLLCKGLLDHARELAPAEDDTRTFRRGPRLRFGRNSCFVLTPEGVEFVASMLERAGRAQRRQRRVPSRNGEEAGRQGHVDARPVSASTPSWDRDRQELRLGDVVVKQFKVPAPNQERILATFEEEGWPVRIDDPLPPANDQDPKARLHDTIVSLNRNQKRPLLRFYGDGTGQGVRWGIVVVPKTPASSLPPDGERNPKAK